MWLLFNPTPHNSHRTIEDHRVKIVLLTALLNLHHTIHIELLWITGLK